MAIEVARRLCTQSELQMVSLFFHRKRLLTFVVVGGGPTSVEFTSELYDFLQNDVSKWYKV